MCLHTYMVCARTYLQCVRAHTWSEIPCFGIILGVPMYTLVAVVFTYMLHHNRARIYVICYYRSAGKEV